MAAHYCADCLDGLFSVARDGSRGNEAVQRLRSLASGTRRYVRQRLFGNNHSAVINLRYAAYQRRCRRNWSSLHGSTAEEQATAERFRRTGYEVLPPPAQMSASDLDNLRIKVDRLFEKQGGGFRVGEGITRMVDGVENVPEIVDFIDPELEAVLESYYQSHFKIFGIYFYRTVPTPAKPESSFKWHVDNCPQQEIKLMVYLDPVVRDTGAIRLKKREFSDELRHRGFIDRSLYDRFVETLDDDRTTAAVEGPVGTRILFQNGQAIHRAVSPLREHRDVVTFVLIPSSLGWRPHFARSRHLLSTNAGICLDPASDRPQHVGYQF